MKIFNIGTLELLFIILIALIALGPKRMVDSARQFGKWLRKAARSPLWRDVVRTSEDIRNLPNEIMRQSGLDQDLQEVNRLTQESLHMDIDSEAEKNTVRQDAPPDDQDEQEPRTILPPQDRTNPSA